MYLQIVCNDKKLSFRDLLDIDKPVSKHVRDC